jgi:hypothetical protein
MAAVLRASAQWVNTKGHHPDPTLTINAIPVLSPGSKLFPLLVELESLVASDADKNEIASLSEKCCTDFSRLDETKLKDIAIHAKTIAQQILAN